MQKVNSGNGIRVATSLAYAKVDRMDAWRVFKTLKRVVERANETSDATPPAGYN
jgi:hypothetical protein